MALAAAAVLALGACGIKDEASVAAGDFCDQAQALAESGPELPESPEAIEQVADQFDRLADSAPPEIDDDMTYLADIYRQVTDALQESGGDDPADIFAAAAPFFDPENAQRLEEANQNVERYLSEECGVEIDEGASTTLAGGTSTSTTLEVTTSTTEEETTSTTAEETTTTEAEETTTTTGGGGQALPPGEPPGDLGDDPALDALADQCFEGDMQACDDLYFQSPIDSAYEEYGDTCGGRNEPMGLCTTLYGGG
ncbi:MAG TPA: hypothetical protein VGB14_10865 [Acidimicrobiales bacterium]